MGIDIRIVESDVLVIGSGLAGSMAALSCLQENCQVVIVNKGKMCWSGSTAACGGNDVAVCFPGDDLEMWTRVFVESSDYTVDQRWIQIFLDESYEQLKKMEKVGYKYGHEIFPKRENGEYWRIHRAINPFETVLCDIYGALHVFENALKDSSAQLFERTMITDLLCQNDHIVGAVGFHCRTGEKIIFLSKTVILAAGCCTYKVDVFDVCGEGYGMAYNIGAKMMSFDRGGAILRPRNIMRGGLLCNSGSSSIASALGSKIINCQGIDLKECMTDEEKELGRAGQDAAIQREINKGNGPIYEDYVHLPQESKKLLKKLREASLKRVYVEYRKEPFEELVAMENFEQTVTPDQSNRMGGVWIDENGETSVKGLFAVGDNSCPKLSFQHPYNGSDLGWALLSGGRVGQFVARACRETDKVGENREKVLAQAHAELDKIFAFLRRKQGLHPDQVKKHLQEALIPYDKKHCDARALSATIEDVEDIIVNEVPIMYADNLHDLRKVVEASAMAQVAKMILISEKYRKESRVGVRRQDYPLMDNNHWKKWIGIRKEGETMKIFTEEIPETLIHIPSGYMKPLTNRL